MSEHKGEGATGEERKLRTKALVVFTFSAILNDDQTKEENDDQIQEVNDDQIQEESDDQIKEEKTIRSTRKVKIRSRRKTRSEHVARMRPMKNEYNILIR